MTTTPRRGRPPRFTREAIIEAVADMLVADPAAPLTIARAAEAVGAKPMSLYRHFADRDDLVAAVARHLFAEVRVPVDPAVPWQDQVRTWMTAVYRQACRVPQLVQLLASGESTEWLADSAHLAAVFEAGGVDDDQQLAEAVYWVATTTMGHAMIYAAGHEQRGDGLVASYARLDDADAARMARLLPRFDAMHDDAFDRVVTWTIAGLEELLR